jgi:acyl carrier protein
MPELTLEHLRKILESSSGEAEDFDWASTQALDTPFDEIGYDSLALLEVSARVQQMSGVKIPDDAVHEMKTPRKALTYLNERLAQQV